LLDDTFCNKVDDMCKATCSVGRAREFWEEGDEVINHGVVVNGIVASDAQTLHKCE
jgi:hypothetical protein